MKCLPDYKIDLPFYNISSDENMKQIFSISNTQWEWIEVKLLVFEFYNKVCIC